MADALKTARSTAKAQFTRAEKKLNDCLAIPQDQQGVPVATIKRRFDDLSTKWSDTQNAHDAYKAAVTSDLTAEQLELEELWIRHCENVKEDAFLKALDNFPKLKKVRYAMGTANKTAMQQKYPHIEFI